MSAAAALALAAALAVYPVLAAPRLQVLEIALGSIGVLALAVTLLRSSHALGATLLALAGAVIVLELVRARSLPVLIAYASALITLGELSAFSSSLHAVELVERSVVARRLGQLALIALGGLAVSAIAALASRIAIGGGLSAGALGVIAAVLVLALTAGLDRARRRGRSPTR
ncbi:MAG TPA: hypothetical protein VFC22_03335 [Solirubrobacteraceae bacterium]|nr:hypothetical protein [Solirubrobacteraceae bacterium]